MSSIGAISPSTAISIIRPVAQSGNGGSFQRDERANARQAYATAGTKTGNTRHFAGDDSRFIAQAIANDNNGGATFPQGAIAYLMARDRLSDLPVGFLIAKAV